jgi:hypothetical protein
VARTRTTKKLAQRIDLNYFKRPTPFKRAKLWFCVLVPLAAVAWIAWHWYAGDPRVYSSGRMSAAHAVLETQCAACHEKKAGEFSSKVGDSACLGCHDGPAHHETASATLPTCGTCHAEHRGRIDISAANDQVCAVCHANLKTVIGVSANGSTIRETNIRTFADGHPEFAALRPVTGDTPHDSGTIKLNHAIHLKPIRRGPNGPDVQLVCRDCHRLQADSAVVFSDNVNPFVPSTNWLYADIRYLVAKPSYAQHEMVLPIPARVLPSYSPPTGREFMARVSFAKACSGCHSLAFDKRFNEGVPHDGPEVVREFLMAKFQQYIAAYPDELRAPAEANRGLAKNPGAAMARTTPAQWTAERSAEAEELLWRKTCKQCHELRFLPNASQSPASLATLPPLPYVEPNDKMGPWMPRSTFGHDAHRSFSCVSCHQKALSSTEESGILLPGIKTCKTCHGPGPQQAESRCFECHTYHDWSKRKEVKATFLLPALATAGQ